MTRPSFRIATLASTIAMVIAAALAWTSAATSAPPLRGALYEGPAPKGGDDVSLLVSGDGRRVRRFFFGVAPGSRRAGRSWGAAGPGACSCRT